MWWNAAARQTYAELDRGKKIVVRALPGRTRTEFVEAIIAGLDASAVVVRERGDAANLSDRVVNAVNTAGGVTVVVPDFSRLIRETWGRGAHGSLTHVCVNHEVSAFVGALLMVVPGEPLSRPPFPGSPLTDRCDVLTALPMPTEGDVRAAVAAWGIVESEVDDCASALGSLIAVASSDELKKWADARTKERLAIRAIAELSPTAGHARLLRLMSATRGRLPYHSDDDELTGVVHRINEDIVASDALRRLGAEEWLLGHDQGWPRNWISSVRRFCCRVAGRGVAYWVDRYLPDEFDRLVDFLGAVAPRLPPTELRLLSGKNLNDTQLAILRQRAVQWSAHGLSVRWRRMAAADIQAIHRRQLFGKNHIDGFTLPPIDRVLCITGAGNEADSYSPAVQRQVVEDAWDQASVWI
jgi:hypothetical protein